MGKPSFSNIFNLAKSLMYY